MNYGQGKARCHRGVYCIAAGAYGIDAHLGRDLVNADYHGMFGRDGRSGGQAGDGNDPGG